LSPGLDSTRSIIVLFFLDGIVIVSASFVIGGGKIGDDFGASFGAFLFIFYGLIVSFIFLIAIRPIFV
jgi:hypothetical protein